VQVRINAVRNDAELWLAPHSVSAKLQAKILTDELFDFLPHAHTHGHGLYGIKIIRYKYQHTETHDGKREPKRLKKTGDSSVF
jgi:hypothetical protein